MAQTTFKLAVNKSDTPLSDGGPSASPASTPGKSNSPNTGFLTQDGAVNKDVLGVVTSPIVSGAFIFAGFILLLALIAKIKKNKQASFNASLSKKHYTTTILAFATFLLFAAGVGGTISRFMGVEAESNSDGFTTSGTVQASLIEIADDYKLYCGEDTLTIDSSYVPYGNFLFMHPEGDGILPSTTSGIANITSAEDWDGLGIGEWGYYVGDYSADAITNPMPINYSIISHETGETNKTTIPVTYCAKVSKNIEIAEYSTTLEYELLPKGEGSAYPAIDFNSAEDDDGDSLSNREENRYGMNPLSADSDMDSLSDYDELKVHHTDPLLEDTDEDGLADYSEVVDKKICTGTAEESCTEYTTNPLVPDYDGTTYTYDSPEDEAIPYTVTGTGDIPLTYIDSTNPVDIDESFENLSGKAYTFQSAGEVEDAEITVPYTTEQTSSSDDDDDTLGAAVAVSDGDISAENINVTSLTFNEDDADEENGTIPASVSEATKTVDNNAKTISINIKDDSAILLVGDSTTMSEEDDEILGAGLLSKIVQKIKNSKVVKAVKSFIDNIKESSAERKCVKNGGVWSTLDNSEGHCIPREKIECEFMGKIWSEKTNRCLPKEQGICENNDGIWDSARSKCKTKEEIACENQNSIWRESSKECISLSWNVSSNFTIGRDSFKVKNPSGYYDKNEDATYPSGGVCFGLAMLARVLYLEKINLNIDHELPPPHVPILNSNGSRKTFPSFSLKGLNKEQILNMKTVEKEQRNYATGPVGEAVFALLWSQLYDYVEYTYPNIEGDGESYDRSDAKYVGPEAFVNIIKNKIDKNKGDDPIVFSMLQTLTYQFDGKEYEDIIGHTVNAISIGRIYQKNSNTKRYYLGIYDNNYPEEAKSWEMQCSLIECAITSATTFDAADGKIRPEYASLVDDSYFLYN